MILFVLCDVLYGRGTESNWHTRLVRGKKQAIPGRGKFTLQDVLRRSLTSIAGGFNLFSAALVLQK
jgi:hypothetical protein